MPRNKNTELNNNNENRHKCHLCPAKGFMVAEYIQCSKCPAKFHKGCAKRAHSQKDGSFLPCCGKRLSNTKENTSTVEASENTNLNKDFQQFAPLWDKLQPYLHLFSNNFEDLKGEISSHKKMLDDVIVRLDDHDDKISSITDELHDLRENMSIKSVDIQMLLSEIKEQKKREKNFIVFNYPDSKDAYKTDTKSIK